jgi:diguanylate cyclase (GGDEF)-like protein
MSWFPLRRLISPLVLLITALVLRQHVATLEDVYLELIQYLPYALLAVMFALCIHYNRARLFIATLSIFIVYYLIQTQLQTALTEQDTLLVYSFISVLHPACMLLLLFLPERGLANRYGLSLLAVVLLVVLSAVFLLHYYPGPLISISNKWLMVRPYTGLILSLPATSCYVVVILAGLYALTRYNDDFAVMLISIALFSFITLTKLNLANISVVMFSAISVSLIIGKLGTSYDMAYRDELTGLLGRRALNDRLKALARRYVIAMMDIDHFKKFNDTHGHDIGDEVLKMVAKQIGAVRGGGRAYRYGGEEFCVVFAGKDMKYCQPFLEQLRQNVQDYRMTVRDEVQRPNSKDKARQRRGRRAKSRKETSVSVTISIGMAEPGDKHKTSEQVLKAADTALYKAKHKGRNCLAY